MMEIYLLRCVSLLLALSRRAAYPRPCRLSGAKPTWGFMARCAMACGAYRSSVAGAGSEAVPVVRRLLFPRLPARRVLRIAIP